MGILDSVGSSVAGAVGAGDMFHSFMHPEEGYKAAEGQAEQYYRDAQGNLQPYNQNGMNMYQKLMQQQQALNDPAALQNQWASGYQESPYAKQQEQNATSSGLDAASSMGLMGSSAALNNIQKSSGEIMQGDRQNYMNDLMQKYMASIGIGQNIYGIGANAAGNMSSNAMNQGQTMAGLKYGETNAPGDQFGKILGTAANLGVNYATGGMSGVGSAMSNYGKNALSAAQGGL